MIPQAQIPQYNAQANQMMGQVAQGIGQLGQAYQDRGFRQEMGGVQSSKDLMELYTMHPDKYDPVRVKQMQQQEEEDMNSSFFEKLEGAQNQSEALNVIKSDPSRYSKKVGEFMESLPSPKKDALRKDFLEEGAYVNTGKMNQLPALFDKREAMVNASDLPPEEKQERLDEITEDREALEAGEDIFAERHRLSEEGVLGADNYKKITEGRAKVGDESRAAGMVKTLEMDKDAKELFIANDKELAMNNEEARKLDSLSARMVGPDGNPIEFGGAPETYMRKFKQFWTGMSGDKPQKDLLIKELKGVALAAAFKLKQAGAMSDPEFNQYISTVPTANDSEQIVGPWINNVMKNNKKAFAALTISNKFLEANGTAKSAKEKFVIDIDGKKITVNKGNNIQTVLRKIGQKLSDYTPSVGGSDVPNPPVDPNAQKGPLPQTGSAEDIDSFLDTL
tara:strand:+ start:113 stop:1459 length:1347 start_codon:yes stop_codon:yes gene_type:complete